MANSRYHTEFPERKLTPGEKGAPVPVNQSYGTAGNNGHSGYDRHSAKGAGERGTPGAEAAGKALNMRTMPRVSAGPEGSNPFADLG